MKTVVISGVIGWDVSPSDVRKQLDEANGEPIDIQISSPGGFVFDGLEIFNLIKGYSAAKTTHLMGLAASMASYIALAGDKITAEANSVFMIHNVLGFAQGNHIDLRKAADVYEGFSIMLAGAYATKTKKPVAEIRSMMDAETFLFGSEGKDAGFIDEIIGEPSTEKASAISTAKAARASCDDTVRKFSDQDSTTKIAALLPVIPAGVASSAAATSAAPIISQKEARNMDLPQLKAEHPEAYTAAKAEGIAEERARRESLIAFKGINTDGDRAAEEAIASGKAAMEATPAIMAAIAKGKSPDADGDNPPSVSAKVPESAAGAASVSGMSAEDVAALIKAGLTMDEIKANGPSAAKE
jgi:ATP-dependent protease ClpP protease subunit